MNMEGFLQSWMVPLSPAINRKILKDSPKSMKQLCHPHNITRTAYMQEKSNLWKAARDRGGCW